jgi:hypothetical protein
MNVRAIKAINGIDLLFGQIETNPDTGEILLKKCVVISATQGPDGKPNLGFMPCSFYQKDAKRGADITIQKEHIFFEYIPNDDIVSAYIEFSTGITPAPKAKTPGLIL